MKDCRFDGDNINYMCTDSIMWFDTAEKSESCVSETVSKQIKALILRIIRLIHREQYKTAAVHVTELKKMLVNLFYSMSHCNRVQYEYLVAILSYIDTLRHQYHLHALPTNLIQKCIHIFEIQHCIFHSMFPIPSLHSLNVLHDMYTRYFDLVFKIYFSCYNKKQHHSIYISEYMLARIHPYIKHLNTEHKERVTTLLESLKQS